MTLVARLSKSVVPVGSDCKIERNIEMYLSVILPAGALIDFRYAG